jgi:anti-sigma regulatory factor (Ser/Thr protein kinase)
MAEIPNLHLHLTNSAENVLVVRQALSGVANCLALDAIESNDVNTAVTEACNNVVMHAYGDEQGPLEVDLYVLPRAIAVVVRDYGHGIGDPAEQAAGAAYAGMGIPVIEALTDEVSFTPPVGGGTEVRMRFATPDAVALEADVADNDEEAAPQLPMLGPAGTVELRLAPTAIARAVLPRVLSVLAARTHFATDRIADLRLIAEVLASNAGDSLGASHLDVRVAVAPHQLELRIGPFVTGCGESLMTAAADGLAPVIERLTDASRVVRVADDDGRETLELRLVDAGSR